MRVPTSVPWFAFTALGLVAGLSVSSLGCAPGEGGIGADGSGGSQSGGSVGSGSGGARSGSGGAPSTPSGGSGTGGSSSSASGGSGASGASVGSGGSGSGGARAGTGGGAAGRPGSGGSSAPTTGGNTGSVATGGRGGAGGAVDQNALPTTTLFIAGDSTAMDYGTASAQQGWGQHLVEFFIPKVTISNQALGGRSLQTFMFDDVAETMEASRWTTIKTRMKAGDFVMIDFGINDSGSRPVTVPDFQRLLGSMVDTILAAKATPIFVTPSALQSDKSGTTFTNVRLGPYCAAMKTVAPTKGVLVDDLNARSVANLNVVGQAGADMIYYLGDKAHFTQSGATLMAQFVVEELVRIGSPLGAYKKP